MVLKAITFYRFLYREQPLHVATDGVGEPLKLAGAFSDGAAAADLGVVVKDTMVVRAGVVNLASDLVLVVDLVETMEGDGAAGAPVITGQTAVPTHWVLAPSAWCRAVASRRAEVLTL